MQLFCDTVADDPNVIADLCVTHGNRAAKEAELKGAPPKEQAVKRLQGWTQVAEVRWGVTAATDSGLLIVLLCWYFIKLKYAFSSSLIGLSDYMFRLAIKKRCYFRYMSVVVYRYEHGAQTFPIDNDERTVAFIVNDGTFNSSAAIACIRLVDANDSPALFLGGEGVVDVMVMYSEGQSDPLPLAPQLTITGEPINDIHVFTMM